MSPNALNKSSQRKECTALDTKKCIALIISAFAFSLHVNADDAAAWSSGQSFGGTVKSYYGNNMKSELFTPMTSDTEFKTMDGSKTFKANMTCGESSKSFMTVSYSLGSPQNGAVPVIKMDKDLDGTKEYTFVSPYTASAVCANGIAVCSGGNFETSSGCTYYKWNYNGSAISLVSSLGNVMSSCSCVNDTCGSLASAQKDSLSNKIASGVYGSVSAYSSNFIVSQTETNNGIVEYFGQRTDSCQNYKGTMATTGTSASLDSSTEIANQTGNSSSAYTSVLGASSNYSTNSPKITTQVNTTTASSKSALTSTTHTDGTTDFTTKDSNGTTLPGHVGIPLTSDNEEYCQVKWLGTSTEVFTDGTERSTSTSSGTQWQTETRLCTNHVCPYQASKGESIKFDCGNIDSFSEATAALSAVQELADDITCGSI